MNLKDIQDLEKEKEKVIRLLETENITSFVFACDIDDKDADKDGNMQSTMVMKYFAQSTKEAIGLAELLKVKLLSWILRNDQ